MNDKEKSKAFELNDEHLEKVNGGNREDPPPTVAPPDPNPPSGSAWCYHELTYRNHDCPLYVQNEILCGNCPGRRLTND